MILNQNFKRNVSGFVNDFLLKNDHWCHFNNSNLRAFWETRVKQGLYLQGQSFYDLIKELVHIKLRAAALLWWLCAHLLFPRRDKRYQAVGFWSVCLNIDLSHLKFVILFPQKVNLCRTQAIKANYWEILREKWEGDRPNPPEAEQSRDQIFWVSDLEGKKVAHLSYCDAHWTKPVFLTLVRT